MTENSSSILLVVWFRRHKLGTDVVVSVRVVFKFLSFAIVLPLIGAIIFSGTEVVVPLVKAVEVGSTYCEERVSVLVINKVFMVDSLELRFLGSYEGDG